MKITVRVNRPIPSVECVHTDGLRYFYGDFDIDKSLWFTHPELEELYRSVDRQDVPNSYDGVAQGVQA
jgi:hypothetical protein